jgi:peptidoglycan/xylan/chitin deacetylase (PgdA/CDA1 family)
MLEVEKMIGNKNTTGRRNVIRGLLVLAMILLVSSGWGTATYSGAGSSKTSPLKSASVDALSSQHNPPASWAQVHAVNATEPTVAIGSKAAVSTVQKATATVASKPQKIVYITFDDGPSTITRNVLDILQKEEIKATFFVLGNAAESHPELINAIWEQGHAIGNHTYNHNYHDLYSRFTEFWSQIKQTENIVRGITGVRPQLVRAPGGTFGHFDDTYFYLLKQAGYLVTDWTVDSGDSKRKGVPAAEILQASTKNLTASKVVLLLHDGGGHGESAKALPEIIARYKKAGYSFGVLDEKVEPVQFKVSAKAAELGRAQPSKAWVASNILPNAGLFGTGRTLALEVGMMETKLNPGEYKVINGQYRVPLRAVVERLGGKVSWDKDSRSGRVVWNGRTLAADVAERNLTLTLPDGTRETRSAKVDMIGGSIWVPLRDLLETAGHPLQSVSANGEERRVKAS